MPFQKGQRAGGNKFKEGMRQERRSMMERENSNREAGNPKKAKREKGQQQRHQADRLEG